MSYPVPLAPLFPLGMVPFVGESINLHIFEDRYKSLAADCLADDQPFGIPPYISGKLCGYGGLIEIVEVVQRYPDGRLDLRCSCVGRFRLLEFSNPAPGQLYAGGRIEVLDPDPHSEADRETQTQLVLLVQRLYQMLEANLDASKLQQNNLSYALGHKLGLSLDQEYELFLMTHEEERQQYLIAHLSRTIPTLEELNRTRARISLNGHFQKFDPLTF